MDKKEYNNVTVITDGSYRAVQAHELAKQLQMLGVGGNIQISCGLDVVEQAAKTGAGFKVNILDPQNYYDAFDMVVVSSHEPHPAHDNIVEVTGLINHISAQFLESYKKDFGIGTNMLAVLVGGRHVGGNFTVEDAGNLADLVNSKAMPALITTSRRTEAAAAKALKEQVRVPMFFYDYNEQAQVENPFYAMLASATEVIVTADSVRMVSEAASSGRALSIFTPKETHFSYVELRNKVMAANLPLNEASRIASIIAEKISK